MPTPSDLPTHAFTRVLINRLDGIAPLADALGQWGSEAQVPPKTIGDIHLMLDELITNVVMHGYPPAQQGEIHVNVWHSPGRVDVQLRDHALAYDPLSAAMPDLDAGIEDRAIGGLGVYFVRQLADEVTYERVQEDGQGTNLVHIVKLYALPPDQAR